MSALLTSTFRSGVAKTILTDIQYGKSKYFHFIGRIAAWNVSDIPPTTVDDKQDSMTAVRNEMVLAKRVDAADVSIVIDRIDWISGNVWDMWDSGSDMTSARFYVMTADYRVYKCLHNNWGAVSTVMPTSTSVIPALTADGYLWKYMYTVADTKRARFLSAGHIPVQQSVSDRFYNNGAITRASVTASGSGYVDTVLTTLTVSGAVGSGGQMKVATIGASGQVLSMSVVTGGTGYVNGARINITSVGGGSGFTATVLTAGGAITGVNIINAGGGYAVNDIGNITVGGAALVPKISATTGAILDVIILDGGIGYPANPTVTIVDASGLGSGMYGATATFTAFAVGGVIKDVTVADIGKNYPVNQVANVTVLGDGINASFTPIIYGGQLIDVVTENAGSGYSFATLHVVSSSGSGAACTAILEESDFTSDQAAVEQTSIDGAIYAINVVTPGSSYISASVTVTGDGTGCTAHPVLVDGHVSKIIVDTIGSGYSYATVTVNDTATGATLATARAIYSPVGGHGKNAPEELYGRTVAVYSNLRGLLDASIQQDFRQYGLATGLRDYYTNAELLGKSGVKAYIVTTFNNTVALQKDEILTIGTGSFRVLNANGNTVNLVPLTSPSISPVGVLSASTGGRTYTCTSLISAPDYNKYSGQIVYYSDDSAFSFTDEQSIIIKTYIRF